MVTVKFDHEKDKSKKNAHNSEKKRVTYRQKPQVINGYKYHVNKKTYDKKSQDDEEKPQGHENSEDSGENSHETAESHNQKQQPAEPKAM